jgi:hypothetical protein
LENVGSEVFNFDPAGQQLFGYAQPPGAETTLERIVPEAAGKAKVTHVLAVFVAKRPAGGQVVVGWYQDATVLRKACRYRQHRHKGGGRRIYNFICRTRNAVLLPPRKRVVEVRPGAQGMGQANLCYPLQSDGSAKKIPWMRSTVDYVRHYNGPNLLLNPLEEEQAKAIGEFDKIHAAGHGQGWAVNEAQRRAIERYAMKRATKYFKRFHRNVEDVSQDESYDLRCSNGQRILKVEVKGTTGTAETVFLTKNEGELARRGGCALFVLHSIKLAKGTAFGGRELVCNPWNLKNGRLQPITYSYILPSQT